MCMNDKQSNLNIKRPLHLFQINNNKNSYRFDSSLWIRNVSRSMQNRNRTFNQKVDAELKFKCGLCRTVFHFDRLLYKLPVCVSVCWWVSMNCVGIYHTQSQGIQYTDKLSYEWHMHVVDVLIYDVYRCACEC